MTSIALFSFFPVCLNFRLFMTTRNPKPELPPDGSAIISEVNFTTTRAGLTGQVRLLGSVHWAVNYLSVPSSRPLRHFCLSLCNIDSKLQNMRIRDSILLPDASIP